MQTSWLPVLEEQFQPVPPIIPDPLDLPHWVTDLAPRHVVVISTNRTLGGETGTFLLYLLPLESWHNVIPCLCPRLEPNRWATYQTGSHGTMGPARPGAFWQSRFVFLQLLWKEQGERFLALGPG